MKVRKFLSGTIAAVLVTALLPANAALAEDEAGVSKSTVTTMDSVDIPVSGQTPATSNTSDENDTDTIFNEMITINSESSLKTECIDSSGSGYTWTPVVENGEAVSGTLEIINLTMDLSENPDGEFACIWSAIPLTLVINGTNSLVNMKSNKLYGTAIYCDADLTIIGTEGCSLYAKGGTGGLTYNGGSIVSWQKNSDKKGMISFQDIKADKYMLRVEEVNMGSNLWNVVTFFDEYLGREGSGGVTPLYCPNGESAAGKSFTVAQDVTLTYNKPEYTNTVLEKITAEETTDDSVATVVLSEIKPNGSALKKITWEYSETSGSYDGSIDTEGSVYFGVIIPYLLETELGSTTDEITVTIE